jgi:transposase
MSPLVQEKNPEVLRQAALILERENERLIAKNLELQRENLRLKGMSPSELQQRLLELERQIAAANKARFGQSSEKRPRQKAEEMETPAPQTGHGPTEQPSLERVDEIHRLDEPDKICPQCGGDLKEWAGQFEESELVDTIERKWVIRKITRQKYRCGCQACVDTALGPTMLIPGGRYAPNVAVEVAVSKYLDHAPLQRQVRIMAREGLQVTAQTLWDQIEAAARLLEPTYEKIYAYVLTHELIGTDESHWKLLAKNGGELEQKRWQAWTVVAPDAVAYRIVPSRSIESAKKVLRGYRGLVTADGYGVYEHLASHDGIVLCCCWAHVRRKFVELDNSVSEQTRTEILDLIAKLYESEHAANGDREVLARLRQKCSSPVIDEIRTWLFAKKTEALPRSALAKAVNYALHRWIELTRFLTDVRIPLDNNASERAMRGPVIGRKNHYGSKSQRGTEVAALYYTLCESAKLVDVDAKAYIRNALKRAIAGEPPLLPGEFKALRDADATNAGS